MFVSMTAAGLLLNVARAVSAGTCTAVARRDMMSFAVITGGGTAGHVLPALAIAEELEERGHPAGSLHYVGAQRGIETRLLPETPYPHTFLDVVGVQRRAVRGNVAFLPKLVRAAGAARRLLGELRPRVVVSVGGYASLPAVLAARRLRIPVVVVSFDRLPGRASALAARFAAASAVAFEGSPLPRAVVTGAPVRRAIREVDRVAGRDAARAALGLPDRPLRHRRHRWVAGLRGAQRRRSSPTPPTRRATRTSPSTTSPVSASSPSVAADVPPRRTVRSISVVGYERRMDLVYAAADLLVGRGGASTVAEVAVTGTPSILVPWPAAAEDHQTDNVRWLADQGAAVHLPRPSSTASAGASTSCAPTRATRRLARNARAAGAVHRRGALGALIERVALPEPARAGQ